MLEIEIGAEVSTPDGPGVAAAFYTQGSDITIIVQFPDDRYGTFPQAALLPAQS